MTGYTLSDQTTFPVVAGYDMAHNGLKDAFIAKVNASGSALTYCTYIGGAADDVANGIAVDGLGNAYIGGSTGSSAATFCEITGPDLSFNGGTTDAFVCKLNSAGNGRVYCGYIGGDGGGVGQRDRAWTVRATFTSRGIQAPTRRLFPSWSGRT